MFTLICVWINGCVNNREAGDLRRYCAHYGVTVMWTFGITYGEESLRRPQKGRFENFKSYLAKSVIDPSMDRTLEMPIHFFTSRSQTSFTALPSIAVILTLIFNFLYLRYLFMDKHDWHRIETTRWIVSCTLDCQLIYQPNDFALQKILRVPALQTKGAKSLALSPPISSWAV